MHLIYFCIFLKELPRTYNFLSIRVLSLSYFCIVNLKFCERTSFLFCFSGGAIVTNSTIAALYPSMGGVSMCIRTYPVRICMCILTYPVRICKYVYTYVSSQDIPLIKTKIPTSDMCHQIQSVEETDCSCMNIIMIKTKMELYIKKTGHCYLIMHM